ncbi:MAG: heme-binding protein [Halioglobus sp.]|nr:heme-binding protein [Halioglobus sp.]
MMRILLSLLVLVSGGVQAQIINITALSTDGARQLVTEGLKQCASDGYHVSVAVVDASGALKALARSDQAGPHTVESARKKAFTAVSLGETTVELADLVADKPNLAAALSNMHPDILILGGGIPVRYNGQLVAGIGVGGAPGGELDEACAKAAVKAVLQQAQP